MPGWTKRFRFNRASTALWERLPEIALSLLFEGFLGVCHRVRHAKRVCAGHSERGRECNRRELRWRQRR